MIVPPALGMQQQCILGLLFYSSTGLLKLSQVLQTNPSANEARVREFTKGIAVIFSPEGVIDMTAIRKVTT